MASKILAFTRSRGWIESAHLARITGCCQGYALVRIKRFIEGKIDEDQLFAPPYQPDREKSALVSQIMSEVPGITRDAARKRVKKCQMGKWTEEELFRTRHCGHHQDQRWGNDEWLALSNRPRNARLASIPDATPTERRLFLRQPEKEAGRERSVQEIMRVVGCAHATAYWRFQHYLKGEWRWQDCLRPVRRK